MDNLKKTRKVIEKYQNINILPNPKFEKDSFPAALALFYGLKKLGKNVSMLTEKTSETFSFLLDKGPVSSQEADFRISIRETSAKLSDLFYEKTAGGIDLFLKTTGGELKKEDISFEKLSDGAVLITVGVNSFKHTQNFLKKEPDYIINIDNNPANENFGHSNIIEPSSATLSEVVIHTISFLSENLFDKEISTALLAGIIHEAERLQGAKLAPQTFQKIGFLIEQGADLKTISSKLGGKVNESPVYLFGEILTKTHFSENRNLGWALLKESDFRRTNSTPRDLKFTLEKLASGLFPFQNFLILWEHHNSPVSIRGVFYSPNKELTEKLQASFSGLSKGKGVLFNINNLNLQSAKNKIINLLNL